MSIWILTCPKCEAANEVPASLTVVECGVVSCTCTCVKCRHQFNGRQPYWRWLGLAEEPPARDKDIAPGGG